MPCFVDSHGGGDAEVDERLGEEIEREEGGATVVAYHSDGKSEAHSWRGT